MMACAQCGGPVPPRKNSGGRPKRFCCQACGSVWHAAAIRGKKRKTPEEAIFDRKHYSGSNSELEARAKEIAKDPALRAAKDRLRLFPDRPEPVTVKLERLRLARLREARQARRS